MDAEQTSIFIAVLITCIILAVIFIFFIVMTIRHHRQNVLLYKSKLLAEVTAMENERTRIANDLHDEMGPVLSSIKLRVNNLEIHTGEDEKDLGEVNQNIDDMMQQLRIISNNLMPSSLLRKGLVAAMNESLNRMAKPDDLDIVFHARDIPVLSQDKAINLYRILQEIIHNTIKHAHAKKLIIELSTEKDHLVMMTQDDGRGFDYQGSVKESAGFGLRSLLSRAEILGGELLVESKKEKGTSYFLEIPVS